MAACLIGLAAPATVTLARYPAPELTEPSAPLRQFADGFVAIWTRRALLRATATSAISYAGIGMLIVCCPLLGQQRLGGEARGALLISVAAAASLIVNGVLARRRWRGQPDIRVFVSTLIIGASMAAVAVAPGWLIILAVAISGAGEGPQLTALFQVRHREAPAHMRGQIFTTAASLKIGGLAAGAALAGPLAERSVSGCLLVAAGIEVCAAAAYFAVRPYDGVMRSAQWWSAG
jgi:hypothetical protein